MLYQINKRKIESSSRMQIVGPDAIKINKKKLREKDIENFLASLLEEGHTLGNKLMKISQSSAGEEADILALDEEGTLYIFELKKWESRQENLLQILRYGQKFGRYHYEELEGYAKNKESFEGDMNVAHQEHFDLSNPLPKSEFNQKQVFVLVTHGMDKETISAIQYWTQKGIQILAWPYYLYSIGNQSYIEFNTYPFGETPRFFIVNTNVAYMKDAWKDMLENGKTGRASAYWDKKEVISNNISKGSVVYLYHSGQGVIAKGVATSNYKVDSYDGGKDNEHYVPLKFEWALNKGEKQWKEKVVAPWQINQEYGSSYRFRQTVFSISQEMAEIIDNIAGYNEIEKNT